MAPKSCFPDVARQSWQRGQHNRRRPLLSEPQQWSRPQYWCPWTGIADKFQTNLIMPEPTLFLNQKLGPVAIIRPTSTQQGGAVASVQSFADDGLFLDPATNKNTGIVHVLLRLAEAADATRRRL